MVIFSSCYTTTSPCCGRMHQRVCIILTLLCHQPQTLFVYRSHLPFFRSDSIFSFLSLNLNPPSSFLFPETNPQNFRRFWGLSTERPSIESSRKENEFSIYNAEHMCELRLGDAPNGNPTQWMVGGQTDAFHVIAFWPHHIIYNNVLMASFGERTV